MKSINFPKIFSGNVVTLKEDDEAVGQNIRTLLLCNKGELQCDPEIGIDFKRYQFEQNGVILKDLLIDEIYVQLKLFMPNITVNRDDIIITQDHINHKGRVYVTINCRNKKDFQLNTYNLVLFDTEI